MAASRFDSEQYTSEAFVESAGAVLFRLSTREICVLHLLQSVEYVLAKGRRNCGEDRQATALREVSEETGFSCRLLPLDMHTRAPPAVETELSEDRARFQSGVCEPFTLQVRHIGEGQIKLVWWFVAAVDEETPPREVSREGGYAVEFCGYADARDKLTFQMDREMVGKAIELAESTYG